MKFRQLVIQNFDSYNGEHKLLFNTTDDQPVTIIYGGGGHGKTSIFDALNWAIYGEQFVEVLRRDFQKDIIDCVNVTALKESQSDQTAVEMSSTLSFDHDECRYRVQQAICVMFVNGRKQITDQMSTLYKIDAAGNSVPIPHIESFINQILPNNVRDYFLFNGDRINQLSMPGSSEEIRNGIYRVVDLEILQNGSEHLEAVAKAFRRSARSHAVGEVADLEDKYAKAHLDLDTIQEQQRLKQGELMASENKIEVIEAKLREMDGVNQLQKKRDVLKEQYKQNQANLKVVIQNIRTTAAVAVMNGSIQTMKELRNILDEQRELGEIPSSISTNLLRDILKMKRCICEEPFKEGDHRHTALINRLERELNKQSRGNDLLDLYFQLGQAVTDIEKAIKILPQQEAQRLRLEQESTQISQQIKILEDQLSVLPQQEIAVLATNMREYAGEITNLKIWLNDVVRKIAQKENEIRELQTQREKLGLQQKKVKQYQLRDDLAQKSADLLSTIFKDFATQSRQEVEEQTKEEFVRFIPSASALEVGIDEDFHYNVRDNLGQPALQQLSNGQKQALSLAYITSISRVSGKYPPLVIDMPLARLDEDVQMNIAARLPELSSQVILLLLPGSEWNENTRGILWEKSSNIYGLNFDPKLRQTTIEKVK